MTSTTRGPSQRRSHSYGFALLLAFTVMGLFINSVVRAQVPLPNTAVPLHDVYGMPIDSFFIAARLAIWAPNFDLLWRFADEMKFNAFEQVNGELRITDSLRNTASSGHSVIANFSPVNVGGFGREARIYPFDSAQTLYNKSIFATYLGRHDTNSFNGFSEAVYDSANPGHDTVVASQVAFGYKSWQTNRFPLTATDTAVQNSSLFFAEQYRSNAPVTHYFAITGHLFNPATDVQARVGFLGDTLLIVELWDEIPEGSSWLRGVDTNVAASDTSILYGTFPITKQRLMPPDPNAANAYGGYRTVIDSINVERNGSGLLGPVNTLGGSAHRFDIRIRWTNKEKLALHSVAIRDSVGQLMLGDRPQDSAYRASIVSTAARLLYGPSLTPGTTPVIRFYTGDEGKLFEHEGYNVVDSLLYSHFGNGDSTTKGVRAYRAMAHLENLSQYTLDNEPEITVETYQFDPAHHKWMSPSHLQQFYGLPFMQPPSLKEHNGGRFTIPVVDTNAAGMPADSGVRRYTQAIQRQYASFYVPPDPDSLYGSTYNQSLYQSQWSSTLGHAAYVSRRTGKPIIQWPGTMSPLNLNPKWDDGLHTVDYDSTFTRIIEMSELRMMINLGLCYGTRGVHYSQLGTDTNDVVPVSGPGWDAGNTRYRAYSDFSTIGYFTYSRDNYQSPLRFAHGLTIPNFYTGWGNGAAEMQWLGNTWLPKIGREMRRLQWRDGYSMHFAQLQTWLDTVLDNRRQVRQRSFPSDEVVQGIRARSRTGELDSLNETYVELGLFDTLHGATSYDDTLHCFLVNRRTFERPRDISSASVLGGRLDSLAETRTLMVLFNIEHPDTTSYNFIHITEVSPDTSRLPLASVARSGLDTVVHGDSAVALTLRPGGAALLRITYCKPDDSLAVGDIRFNNQKKMVWDGKYWHCVFFRKLRFKANPGNPLDTTTMVDDAIFYRRSYSMNNSIGTIRWDPQQQFRVVVSDTSNAGHRNENRFPSLTVRNDSSKPGERVVTVVWSSYGNNVAGKREIRLRNIFVNDSDTSPTLGPIEKVAEYSGRNDSVWGTPVVSRLYKGYVIAWSDSLRGILARLRNVSDNSNWWSTTGTYSTPDTVGRQFTLAGVYPSMPPFAHVNGRDSSVAIVWQQPEGMNGVQIRYARLVHKKPALADVLYDTNRMRVSQVTTETHMHPSIDMTQDVWFGAQEGVTWESKETYPKQISTSPPAYQTYTKSRLHFSSLWTETSRGYDTASGLHYRPYHDSIEQAWQWTYNTLEIADLAYASYADIFPSTASLNARIDTLHATDSIYFSIATSPIPSYSPMQQSIVQYATDFLWSQPRSYELGGYYPNMASSLNRLTTHEAVVYQADRLAASRLETTKQFFAKSRPHGYMAYGRRVHFRLADSGATAMSGALHDVWYSGDGGIGTLKLAVRPDSLRRTDDLGMVQELFRTEYFHAHDSTQIGCKIWGRLAGDTALASGMRVEFVTELVDSATDLVVARIDSFAIAPGLDSTYSEPAPEVDLLSGTYYVRMRIEPVNVTVDTVDYTSLYPVEELAGYVPDEHPAKLRRLDGAASQGRITAQPNPVPGTTELRFSVPTTCRTFVLVHDGAGHEVRSLINGEMMEAGRYAIDLDATDLPPGSYMVEFRYGSRRSVQKIVVVR
jgi:hypothetical protein